MHPYRYPAQLALFWIATTLLVAVAGAWQPVPLDSHSHIQTTLKTCIKTIPKNKSRHYGLPISASLLSPSIDAATETSSTWHSKLRIATSECLGAASAILLCFAAPAGAVSGGGLDYANMDITGQDFSNGVYKGKDFTQGECDIIDRIL